MSTSFGLTVLILMTGEVQLLVVFHDFFLCFASLLVLYHFRAVA